MAYVLANKASKNQMLYAFEPNFTIESIEYKTVRLDHVQYDHQGNILIDSDTLKEFELLGVPIFEKNPQLKRSWSDSIWGRTLSMLGFVIKGRMSITLQILKHFQAGLS
ncbi:hypothetical protein [Vibrio parahaemolyticus]|uniref:hypothetical protein n=1 Tax=Vibrio parahaemolyticus TaxID=670 RepID=UPI00263ECFB5|nr:hypothetical protein [Vibrio parahaemolyticus]MDN4734793.1 hypothetical protein [Vibrio parahaemolyticus]MDS1911399.1 hypothetical protein [Vibrio parahaemolyticus]